MSAMKTQSQPIKSSTGLRYLGGGFVPGIPARDLSATEVDRYGGRAYLLKLGLYALKETESTEENQTEVTDGGH